MAKELAVTEKYEDTELVSSEDITSFSITKINQDVGLLEACSSLVDQMERYGMLPDKFYDSRMENGKTIKTLNKGFVMNAVFKAAQLGINPHAALTSGQIWVLPSGQLSVMTESLLAQVSAAGWLISYRFEEEQKEMVVVAEKENKRVETKVGWKEVEHLYVNAGEKSPWKLYTKTMWRWYTIRQMLRTSFAHFIHGVKFAEEVYEYDTGIDQKQLIEISNQIKKSQS